MLLNVNFLGQSFQVRLGSVGVTSTTLYQEIISRNGVFIYTAIYLLDSAIPFSSALWEGLVIARSSPPCSVNTISRVVRSKTRNPSCRSSSQTRRLRPDGVMNMASAARVKCDAVRRGEMPEAGVKKIGCLLLRSSHCIRRFKLALASSNRPNRTSLTGQAGEAPG